MRNYTALDMMRIVRISKEKKYKHLNRFKLLQAYKKEFPELSEEEKMLNLRRALGMNMSRRLNPKNHNHYITMCRRYTHLQHRISEAHCNTIFTKGTTAFFFNSNYDYRYAVKQCLYQLRNVYEI